MKQKPVQSEQPRSGSSDPESKLKLFIDGYVSKMARLEKENNLAYWKATTTGDEEAYQKTADLEYEIRKLHADRDAFAYLKKTKENGNIKDPLLRRQLEILYLSFLENQVEPDLLRKTVDLSTEIQKIFNGYRATVNGKQLSDNDIYDILTSSTDSKLRKEAWLGYQARGKLVKHKLIELVKLRNQIANQLGYKDFYQMRLKLIEQDPKQIEQLFDRLAQGTEKPFASIMQKVNQKLVARYGIGPDEICPWHFEDPFFQEAPSIGKLELDRYFRDVDPKALAVEFFSGIGFEVQDILDRSDLYEKKGKMPHAYCTDIDRKGDVRILANLNNTEKFVSTLLHELGHAVYDKYNNREFPWLLRAPSHSFTTEAVANFFGRLTKSTTWIEAILKVSPDEIKLIKDQLDFELKFSMLVFVRWAMVVRKFEQELYSNPDQNLNKLWWDLKQRYQMIKPPKDWDQPNWAAKIHITSWPAYYHNYLLGELMASQLLADLSKKMYSGQEISDLQLAGRKEIGAYFIEKIFAPGRSLRWDDLLIQATGENLNPEYFIKQFAR